MMRIIHTIATVLFTINASVVMAREFSIPEYQVNPGGNVAVPVLLDNAAGLSMVNFQVNYQASVLELVSVEAGSLGQVFEDFSHETEDGVVRVTLANSANLTSGQGPLAILTFRLLPGGEEGLSADVSLASYDYSDSSGVVALSQQENSDSASGRIVASNNGHIDNFQNGLPDWWEDLYGLNKFSMLTNSMDTDGDGATTLLEYGLGGNPHISDSASLSSLSQKQGDPSVFQFRFKIRADDTTISYRLGTSDNSTDWNQYPITWNGSAWQIVNPAGITVGEAQYDGGGIWDLKFEQARGATAKRFYRAVVER